MIFNTTGGGAALNFRVVGNPQPANPTENCIWVDTDTPITSWLFSATEPSPAEAGMVWINIGISSTVQFNSLKKNGIQVYPLSAKQYISGAWVDKEAQSYQGGAWVAWLPPNRLFKSGFGALVEFTLGKETNAVTPTITTDAFKFTENSSGSYNYAYAITKEPIDVTNMSKIYVEATVTSASKILMFGTCASASSPASAPTDGYTNMQNAGGKEVYEFIVETLSGNRYFKIIGNSGATITDIWYE